MQETRIYVYTDFSPIDFLCEFMTRIQKITKNEQIPENELLDICLDLMREYNEDQYCDG